MNIEEQIKKIKQLAFDLPDELHQVGEKIQQHCYNIETKLTQQREEAVREFRQYVNKQKGLLTNANLDKDVEDFIKLLKEGINNLSQQREKGKE